MPNDKDIETLEAIREATASADAERCEFTAAEHRRADHIRNAVLERLAVRGHAYVPSVADIALASAPSIGGRIGAMARESLLCALALIESRHGLQLAFRHSRSQPTDDDLRRLLAILLLELDPEGGEPC